MTTIEPLKTLLDAQSDVLNAANRHYSNFNKEYKPGNKFKVMNKLEEINNLVTSAKKLCSEIEELVAFEKPNKFPQKIQYDGCNFSLVQHTNGGAYILWADSANELINCGIGYSLCDNNKSFKSIDCDLFITESKADKNIIYNVYSDPYTYDPISFGQIGYNDIKDAIEYDQKYNK